MSSHITIPVKCQLRALIPRKHTICVFNSTTWTPKQISFLNFEALLSIFTKFVEV